VWTAPPGNGTPPVVGYRVYRTEIPPPAGNATTAQPATNSTLPSAPELLGQPTQPEYRDTTVQLDHAYSYTVRSVAQFGSATVESADSAPLAVFAKDTFPPAAPQGLETVIVPETNGVPAYVELAWNISPEADLTGYIIYRSEQSDNTGTRLNSDELLPAPTFRDMTVTPARHYFYRVAAVDHDGNVSPLSPAVEADVP
jgi:fibronectin type 3 domain-containing protein